MFKLFFPVEIPIDNSRGSSAEGFFDEGDNMVVCSDEVLKWNSPVLFSVVKAEFFEGRVDGEVNTFEFLCECLCDGCLSDAKRSADDDEHGDGCIKRGL